LAAASGDRYSTRTLDVLFFFTVGTRTSVDWLLRAQET
jgi:hypothetical protein